MCGPLLFPGYNKPTELLSLCGMKNTFQVFNDPCNFFISYVFVLRKPQAQILGKSEDALNLADYFICTFNWETFIFLNFS